ncbi:MAG: DUF2147 domain-containing protein [Elusimicrobium sp.]|jgi:uncharacterized protein (DUF2147 family)|nr:DUF2147 domain-containing protein [Elusimicrobium sp.]
MKKIMVLLLMLAAVSLKAQDVTGFWQTFYDRPHEPKSIVALYRYDGKIYGRVIIIYQPGSNGGVIFDDIYNPSQDTAANVVHIVNGREVTAKMGGLDVIRGMSPGRGRTWIYEGGFVLNPKSGDEYRARIKFDRDGNLVLRGHLGISSLLGRSQTWVRFDPANFPAGFKTPDYQNFVPNLPTVK